MNVVWARLGLVAAAVCVACGGSSDAGGSSGSGGSGSGTNGCVDDEVSWGMDGGFVAYNDTSRLVPCATFFHSRDPVGSTGPSIVCSQEIWSNANITASSVALALRDPDVRAAVASAPVLYGGDLRPVDGQILRIEIKNSIVEVGIECASTQNCTPIPRGVAALAALLGHLTEQELVRGECGDAFAE